MWYASNDSNVLSFFLPSFLLPRPSRKLSSLTHDILDVIPRCSNDILKSFTNHFFFDTVLYPRHALKWPSQVQMCQIGNTPLNDWQFCHLRDASISRSRLVRTRSLKTREPVKFFTRKVHASTAIAREYAYTYLLTSGSARFSD
ncbi:hypothetical protein D6C98_02662 [Aureobasidium pullulans]|nr:hypothetical protein D6C98_02662 [Aureobasidium pullulans]